MNNVQVFPPTYPGRVNGGIVFWDDEHTGDIQTSNRDFFGVGKFIGVYAQKHPKDQKADVCVTLMKEYERDKQEILVQLLSVVRKACPYKPCDSLSLKEPYDRMRTLFVTKVIGYVDVLGVSYALVGRMKKNDGSLAVKTVIALKGDIATEEKQ